MRTLHLKIIPVECIFKFGPMFWTARCKILSAALYLKNFVLFKNYYSQICLLEETRGK